MEGMQQLVYVWVVSMHARTTAWTMDIYSLPIQFLLITRRLIEWSTSHWRTYDIVRATSLWHAYVGLRFGHHNWHSRWSILSCNQQRGMLAVGERSHQYSTAGPYRGRTKETRKIASKTQIYYLFYGFPWLRTPFRYAPSLLILFLFWHFVTMYHNV